MTLRDLAAQIVSQLGEKGRNVEAYLAQIQFQEAEDERCRTLDQREQYYLGLQHDQKLADWDGRMHHKRSDSVGLHASGYAETPQYKNTSWRFRRPFFRKQLCPAIVDRFTGLLFGSKKQPSLVPTDKDGKAFVDALLKASDWFGAWSEARGSGGAEGSVVVGVGLLVGRPIVEVVNAKWCTPRWVDDDVATGRLKAIQIRYKREVTRLARVKNRDGREVNVLRAKQENVLRIVDESVDVVMTAPADARGDDAWTLAKAPVFHNLGFCPFVWVRNTRVLNDVDGAPDCDQQWDNFDTIDALLSGAFSGTQYNAEPTPVLKTERNADQIAMGNGNSLLLGPNEDALLLELKGTGGKSCYDLALQYRDSVLEDTRCVLDEGQATGRSATELVKRTEAMYERADEFRHQYGTAMETAFEMLLAICRRFKFALEPKKTFGDPTTGKPYQPPKMDDVSVVWPPYDNPTPADEKMTVDKFAAARTAGLVSRATAVRALAPVLGIEDVDAELVLLAAEDTEKAKRYEAILGEDPKPTKPGEKNEEPEEDEPEDDTETPPDTEG